MAQPVLERAGAEAELFAAADRDGDGVISGPEAHRFFARLEPPLSQRQLARVWALADDSRDGFLSRERFGLALRLAAQTQRGESLDARSPACAMPTFADTAAAHRGAPPPASPDEYARARTCDAKPRAAPLAGCAVRSIADGLAALYVKKVLPAEEAFHYSAFSDSPPLSEADFHARPLVLLLGQYSCGKTTFITHLLRRSFPLAVIGPEPTTDRFCVVHHGHDERSTPGHTLSTQVALPFTGLTRFGTAFLNKLVGSQLPSELLEHCTLVDTPGVLSGEKQRLERNYDFAAVTRWFAERADLILLLFDPHKLDISDEFRAVIASLRGHDDKVRVVLNKASSVSQQQLMRVYGALLWALSRVIRNPEVPRIYVGDFPAPGHNVPPGANEALLEAEREDLLHDLHELPRAALGRRVNEFVKRVRAVRLHCLLMGRLRERMPRLMGRERKQAKLLATLPDVFRDVSERYNLAPADFPNVDAFRDRLSRFKLAADFPLLDPKLLRRLNEVLERDVPALLAAFGNPFDET